MRVLIIDDERYRIDLLLEKGLIPIDSTHANNALAAIDEIVDNGPWDEIMFDHDLNTFEYTPYPKEITGYDCARVLLRQDWKPSRVIVHSMNSVGANNIMNLLRDNGYSCERIPFSDLMK